MENELLRWLGALTAAFIGSTLALSRTKRERRWQAKYDAYQRILAGVESIRLWAEETYASALSLPSLGSPQELAKRFDEAKRELWGFVHVGGLVISTESQAALHDLLTEVSGLEFDFDDEGKDERNYPTVLAAHCDKVRQAVARHVPALMKLGKKDLR